MEFGFYCECCCGMHPIKAHLFERRRILAKETNLMEKLPDARNSVTDASCRKWETLV